MTATLLPWLKFTACAAMIGLAGPALQLLSRDHLNLRFLHISIYTPFIFVLYFVAMRAAFVFERRGKPVPQIIKAEPDLTLRMALGRYCAAALVIVVAGAWLPFVGLELADAMGWRTTFVGILFVAGAMDVLCAKWKACSRAETEAGVSPSGISARVSISSPGYPGAEAKP